MNAEIHTSQLSGDAFASSFSKKGNWGADSKNCVINVGSTVTMIIVALDDNVRNKKFNRSHVPLVKDSV